ncbi:hypothetical protein CF065_03655 [Clostridium sporogenes]|uniref:hypothetical protein n=1 Tax=Clostridium sporogenes TaxID=1509 RepID=UPI002238FC3C|nr:hypothetical protein [Clostridium sporogenes]MCW6074136.1 hypothetical protein [Clostridium sporogenes]HDK7168205.1 hypothetical protein [Clostridium botulinum]
MLIKGTCAKKDLMTEIYKAILFPGSNWTEISSNKINDYKSDGNDGWVFKSPPIGYKKENIFMRLKSADLSYNGSSRNYINIFLSDNYTPSSTTGKNGVFTNMGRVNTIYFTPSDGTNYNPDTLYDYYIDVLDYRILMVIEVHTVSTVTYPNLIYIGYPDINTNLEGEDYTNQFVAGSNIYNTSSNYMYWHKAPGSLGNKSQYNKFAKTFCNINNSNPTPMGLYLLNPIYVTGDGVGNNVPDTGFLGVLDGIYGLSSANIVNGDIVCIDNNNYKVFNLLQLSNYYSSLGSIRYIAMKI